MNLTKNNKDVKKRSKGNSGIPNWLLVTIVVVILAAVLISAAVTIFNSTGFLMRINNAASSDNYEVNGNMMAYFFGTAVNNIRTTYGSYWNEGSGANASTIEELRDTVIGSAARDEDMLLTDYKKYEGKSWFDYFMDQTVESVKSMLIYCETARDLKIEYTDKDAEEAEKSWEQTMLDYNKELSDYFGYTINLSESEIIARMYGSTGLKREDILDAMRISTLAAKCAEKVQEQITDSITDDRINKEYKDNTNEYDVIDYFSYEYKVNYDDVEADVKKDNKNLSGKELEEKIVAEYKKQIEEVKELTAKLAAAKALDEFKQIVFEEMAYDKYDELLADKEKDLKADKLPKKEDKATFKDKIVAEVIAEVIKGDEKTTSAVKEKTTGEGKDKTTTYTLYDVTISSEFAKAIKSVRESLFSAVDRIDNTYEIEKGSYSESDDFKKWAFDKQRKDGETKSIASGDGAASGEFKVKDKKYTEKVYFLTKAKYQRLETTRDEMHMLFDSKATAEKAIADLKKIVDGKNKITTEKFEEIAKKYGGSTPLRNDNYIEGSMGVYALDEWLFNEETKVGDYTKEPITVSDGAMMVAFYVEEGDPMWKVLVKNQLISDDFNAREEAMTKKYEKTIDVSQWVLDRIN